MCLEFWNLNKKLSKIKGNRKDQGECNESSGNNAVETVQWAFQVLG